MAIKHLVYLYEFEAGWGSRVDDIEEYDTYEEAEKRVEEFNAKNTELQTPDWYMVAEYAGTKEVEE